MGEMIYGDIKHYIEELAQSLRVAAEHVYGLLVRQQVISGIVTVVSILLAGVVLVAVFSKLLKRQKEVSEEGYDTTEHEFAIVFLGIVLAVVIVVSIIIVPSSVNQIFNPEYYAIKEIMDVFKGGR